MTRRSLAVLASVITILWGGFARPALAKQGAEAHLRWMGALSDHVSRGKAVRPDGRADGHFRLTLSTERYRKIVHVLLRSCDSRGVLTGRAAWDTDQKRLWAVGVFKYGNKLRIGRNAIIDRLKGTARYDLYASAPVGGFKPGEHYCAYVTFDDGMGVYARARVNAPVHAQLLWIGTDRDRVGRGNKAGPDGVPDGHFVLKLNAGKRRVQLTSVKLEALDNAGHPRPGQAWDTTKNRIWVLGVEKKGRRLNRGDRAVRDTLVHTGEYHLYAARRGPFRDGARYRVVARFGNAGPAVATVTVKRQVPATATMTYKGLDADKIGPRSPSRPDGKPDGHFQLTIQAPTSRTITAVVLRAVWPGGAPVQGQVWDTRPRGYKMIAVYRGGRFRNRGDKGFREQFQGTRTYDLYIHNTGWVRPLQNFQAEVVFEGGDRIFAKAKVLQAKPRGPVTLALRYRGFTQDKVGRGAKAGPDGKRDAQFDLTVNTGGRTLKVRKLELSVSDAKGKTWKKTWDTQPGGHWILGVDRGGKRLNRRDKAVTPTITGRATFTLWASNDFWKNAAGRRFSYFTRGGYFTVRLYTASHPVVIRTIRLR